MMRSKAQTRIELLNDFDPIQNPDKATYEYALAMLVKSRVMRKESDLEDAINQYIIDRYEAIKSAKPDDL